MIALPVLNLLLPTGVVGAVFRIRFIAACRHRELCVVQQPLLSLSVRGVADHTVGASISRFRTRFRNNSVVSLRSRSTLFIAAYMTEALSVVLATMFLETS